MRSSSCPLQLVFSKSKESNFFLLARTPICYKVHFLLRVVSEELYLHVFHEFRFFFKYFF